MHGKEFRVVFSSAEWFGTEFRECASTEFWFHGTEFRDVFSSAEGFGTELWDFASIFVPRNGIPSYFLFRGRVLNGIPWVFFNFCSTERNSELFSSPRKGSERNSERFLFRGTAGIPSEIPICSDYSVFRGIMFCLKFPTLVLSPPDILLESCGLFSEWLLILYPMKLSNSF